MTLAFLFVRLNAGRARQRTLNLGKQRGARLLERIARPGSDKCFQHAPVDELRADAQRAGPVAERFGLERALGRQLKQLVLLQENYPQLKADANFRDLSAKLVEVEDALQYARRFYNGAVKQYLTRLQSFPDLLVARLFGFAPMPFFETDERDAVKVDL